MSKHFEKMPQIVIPITEPNNVIDSYTGGKSLEEISTEYELYLKVLRETIAEYNSKLKNETICAVIQNIPTTEYEKIADLYKSGSILKEIAKRYNTSRLIIKNILLKQNVQIRVGRTRVSSPELASISIIEHNKIIESYKNGKTLGEIAATYGVYNNRIRKILIEHNVKIRPRGRVVTEKIRKVKSLQKGRPLMAIEKQKLIVANFVTSDRNISKTANLSNVARSTVIKILNHNGIKIPSQCKINHIHFPFIKERYQNGETMKSISAEYNVSIVTIKKIIDNKDEGTNNE